MEFQDDKVLKKVWICEREYTISMSKDEVHGFEGSINILQDHITNYRKKYRDRDEQDILIMTLVDMATKDLSKNPNEVSASELEGRVAAMVSAITDVIETPETKNDKLTIPNLAKEYDPISTASEISAMEEPSSANQDVPIAPLSADESAEAKSNISTPESLEPQSQTNSAPKKLDDDSTSEAVENTKTKRPVSKVVEPPSIDTSLGITLETPKEKARDIIIGKEKKAPSKEQIPESEKSTVKKEKRDQNESEPPNLFSGIW